MKKNVALLLCFSILFTSSSISYLEGIAFSSLKTVKGVKEIAISDRFGKVLEKHIADENAPFIFCIRDIHRNPKVQLNISSILSSIYQNIKEPSSLYVEGAWGELPISFFREFPSPRARGEIARNYLENKIITGGEFYAVKNSFPCLKIIGIEDPKLYQSHSKIYFKLLKQNPLLAAYLRQLKEKYFKDGEIFRIEHILINRLLKQNIEIGFKSQVQSQETWADPKRSHNAPILRDYFSPSGERALDGKNSLHEDLGANLELGTSFSNSKEFSELNLWIYELDRFFSLKMGQEEWIQFNYKKNERFVKAMIPKKHMERYRETNEFYALAVKRDRAMAENLLLDMKKRKIKQAVLIAGGFHTQGFRKIFKEKKVNYFIIQPSLTDPFPNDFLAPPSQFLKAGFRQEAISKLILLSLFHNRTKHKKRLLEGVKKWLKGFSEAKIEIFEKIFYSRNKAFLALRISGAPEVWKIEKQKKIFNFNFYPSLDNLLKEVKTKNHKDLKSLKDFWKNSEAVKKKERTASFISFGLNVLWFLSLLWVATSSVHTPEWNRILIDPLVFTVQRFFKIFFQFSLIPYQILAPLISISIAHALHGFLIVFLNKFAMDRFYKSKKDGSLFSGFAPLSLMKKNPSKYKFWSPVFLRKKAQVEIFEKSLKKVPLALQIFLYIHNLSALKVLGVRSVGRYYLSPISRFVSSIFLGSILLPLKFLNSFILQIELQWPSKIKKKGIQNKNVQAGIKKNRIQLKKIEPRFKKIDKKDLKRPLEWDRSFVWINFFLSSLFLFAVLASMTFSLWFPILSLQIESRDHLFNFIRYLTHFLFRSNSNFVNFFLSLAPLLGFSVLRDWIFRYPVLYLAVHRIGPFKKDKKLDLKLEIFKGAKGRPNVKLGFRLIKIGGDGIIYIHKIAFRGMPRFLQLRVFQEELIRAQIVKKLELFTALNPYFFMRRYFFLAQMVFLEPIMVFLEWTRSLDILFWRNMDLERFKNFTVLKNDVKSQSKSFKIWIWIISSALAPLGSLWVVLFSPLGRTLKEVYLGLAHSSLMSLIEPFLYFSAIFITYLLGRSLYLLAYALVRDTKGLRKSLQRAGLMDPRTDFFMEKLFSPFFSWISIFLFRSIYLESFRQFQARDYERDAKRELYFSLNDAPFKIEKLSQGLESAARFILEQLNSRRIALGLLPLDSFKLEETLFKIKQNPEDSKEWIKNILAWVEQMESRIEEDQEKIGLPYVKGSLTGKAKELFYQTPYSHFENIEEFKKILIELMGFFKKEIIEKGDWFLLNSLDQKDFFENSTLALLEKFPKIVEESFSNRVQLFLDRVEQDSYFDRYLEWIEKDLADLKELESDILSFRSWLIRFSKKADLFNQALNQKRIEFDNFSNQNFGPTYLYGELENRVRSLLEKKFDESPLEFTPIYHAYQEIEQFLRNELNRYISSAVENHTEIVQEIFEKPLKKEGFHEFLQELSGDLFNRGLSKNSIPIHLERSFFESWVWNLKNNELEEFLFRAFLAHKGFLGQTFYLASGDDAIRQKVDSIFDICFKEAWKLEDLKKGMVLYALEMEKALESVPGIKEKANLTLLVKIMDQSLREENNREWKEILSRGGSALLNSFWNPSLALKKGVGSLWNFLETKILGNVKNSHDIKQFERTFIAMQNEIETSLLTSFKPLELINFKVPNFSQIALENINSPEQFLEELKGSNQRLDEIIILLTQDQKFKTLREVLSRHFYGVKTYLEIVERYPAYIQEIRELLSTVSQKLGISYNSKYFLDSGKNMEQLLIVLKDKEAALKRESIHPALSLLFGENRDLAEPVLKRIWERVQLKNSIKFDLALNLARATEADIKAIENSLQFFIERDVQAIKTIGTGSLADSKDDLEASIASLKSHFLRIIHLLKFKDQDHADVEKSNVIQNLEPLLKETNFENDTRTTKSNVVQSSEPLFKEIKLSDNPEICAQKILKFLQGLDRLWKEIIPDAKLKDEFQSYSEVFWQTLWKKSLNEEGVSNADIGRSIRAVADAAFKEIQSVLDSASKTNPFSTSLEGAPMGTRTKSGFYAPSAWITSRELNLEVKELFREISMALNLMDPKNPKSASSLNSFLENSQNHFDTYEEAFKTIHSLSHEIDLILKTIFKEKGLPYFGNGVKGKVIQDLQNERFYPQEAIHKSFESLAQAVKEKFILFKEKERNLESFFNPQLSQDLRLVSSAKTFEDFFAAQEKELKEFLKKAEQFKIKSFEKKEVFLKEAMEGKPLRHPQLSLKGDLTNRNEIAQTFFRLEPFARNLENELGFLPDQSLVKVVRNHLLKTSNLDLEEFKSIYLALRLEAQNGLEEIFKEKITRLGEELTRAKGVSARSLFVSVESFSKEMEEIVSVLSQEQKFKNQIRDLMEQFIQEKDQEELQSITKFLLNILPILDKAVQASGANLEQDPLLTIAKERLPFAHTPFQFRAELKYFILELKRKLLVSLEMDHSSFPKVLEDALEEPNSLSAFILGSKTLFQALLEPLKQLKILDPDFEKAFYSIPWEGDFSLFILYLQKRLMLLDECLTRILYEKKIPIKEKFPKELIEGIGEAKNLDELKKVYFRTIEALVKKASPLYKEIDPEGNFWKGIENVSNQGFKGKSALFLTPTVNNIFVFKLRSTGRALADLFSYASQRILSLIALSSPLGWLLTYLDFSSFAQTLMIFMATHEWGPYSKEKIPPEKILLPPSLKTEQELFFSNPFIAEFLLHSSTDLNPEEPFKKIQTILSRLPEKTRNKIFFQFFQRIRIKSWSKSYPFLSAFLLLRFRWMRELIVQLAGIFHFIKWR